MRLTGSYQRRWLITPSLVLCSTCCREHGVAIGEARGQRLFDQGVGAGLSRRDCRALRGADEASRCRDVDLSFPRASWSHRRTARTWKRARERVGTLELDVADGDELRLGSGWPVPGRGSGRPCRSPRERCARGPSVGPQSGKYVAAMRLRNASDSAISSMPFMPSSMLIQPS